MASYRDPRAPESDPPFLCAVDGAEIMIYGLFRPVPAMTVDAARESVRRLTEAIARLEFEERRHAPPAGPA